MTSILQLQDELAQFTAADPDDSVTLAYLATGGIDPGRLHTALTSLARRHPVLRAAEAPVVHDTPGAGWEAVDTALKRAESHAAPPFELDGGPLLRADLHRWPGGALLLVHVHRSAVGGPSLTVLEAELESLYGAAGPVSPVEPGAGPALDPDAENAASTAWRDHLAGVGALHWPGLPASPGRPAAVRVPLDRRTLDGLLSRAGATHPRVTPAAAVFAVYGLAVARFTGQRDFCVGLSVPVRTDPGRQEAIGASAGLVPVRVRVGESGTDAGLRSVLDSAAFAVRHQGLGYAKIRACAPQDTAPLLRTVFSQWPRCASRTLRLDGAELAPARLKPRTSPFDVTAEVVDPVRADGLLHLDLSADPTVVDGDALNELAAAFRRTARELTAQEVSG
ncbi:condensation domain-containing protein [Streptomyces sp. NPDC051133]|uniref:condensation domain-containing protein n=1 Tax=Streptomyces sp. NPDC051133 TaxID=3155521 RepID=UPI0034307723